MIPTPARFGRLVLAFALGAALLLAPTAVRGEFWTNAAGHAVEATLLSLDGQLAVFKSPDGTRFTMPLASLSPAARHQVLDAVGRIPVPERLKTDFDLCVRTLTRLGALRQSGGLAEADYAEQRNAALARLKKAFERWDVPESERPRLLLLARNH
jgi:hypothetical protein